MYIGSNEGGDIEMAKTMTDFLGRELHKQNFCVYLKNVRTGTSTVRKIFKKGYITGFTPKKVIFDGYDIVFPEDVIFISRR